jgi:hypothetical protein
MAAPINTDRKRLTVEIPVAIDNMLEMYCTAFGTAKNEVTTRALVDFLSTRKKDIIDRLTDTVAAATAAGASAIPSTSSHVD